MTVLLPLLWRDPLEAVVRSGRVQTLQHLWVSLFARRAPPHHAAQMHPVPADGRTSNVDRRASVHGSALEAMRGPSEL